MPQNVSVTMRAVKNDQEMAQAHLQMAGAGLMSDVAVGNCKSQDATSASITGIMQNQQRNNLSRLRQRFQQVASKAMPISSISSRLANGGNNWAQFTTTVRRTLDENKDCAEESLNNLIHAFSTPTQMEQLVDVSLDENQATINAFDLNHPARLEDPIISECQLVRKAESEPDLSKELVSNADECAFTQGLGDKADSKLASLTNLTLPMRLRHGDRPVLALDLDETLIHSSLVPRPPADFWIEVVQNGDLRTREVFWVYKRPGVDAFLREVAKHYTVLVFTAGIREYAAQILDELDPENKIFSARLYRDSCTETRGLHPSMMPTTAPPSAYAKDMTRICDDMSRIILVDNTPGCFALQPANGLPIKSWYTDVNDRQLERLQEFLCEIRNVDDLRLVLPEWRM